MSAFVSIEEVIELGNLASGDILQFDKMKWLKFSKHIYMDLNMQSMRIAKREIFQINKRTNTIDLPLDFNSLSGVSTIDCHGNFHPVFRNDRLHDDIVDISAKKDCACSCGNDLCNLIKGYEAIVYCVTEMLPDGNYKEFQCVTRKSVDSNGFYYEQRQYPIRQLTNGEWTDTVLHSENIELCKLKVKDGHVCDCEENFEMVNSCGCFIYNSEIPTGGTASHPPRNNPKADTWLYACSSIADKYSTQCGSFFSRYSCNGFKNIYNITELGDRLIFPNNFGHDRVMVRYYTTPTIKNMQIPFIAVNTFIAGLKWFDKQFNDDEQRLAQKYLMDYTKQKWGLFLELNKYRMAEYRLMLSPHVYVPAYKDHRTDNYGYGN